MMNVNWEDVLRRLHSYPDRVHKILPACSMDRILAVDEELGKMPETLSQMLRQFNGAELFIDGGPLVTIFGISTEPPLPPLEWATEWYIDKFTPKWRSAGRNRDSDWAIAMTNYGRLILLEQSGLVKEWDTSQRQWSRGTFTFDEWIEETLREGDAYVE